MATTLTDFELEAMRREDSSWHPCQVSLSSVGDGLSVDFGKQELGVVFLDKEEVLTHLRFRSVPLKGDDCSRIKEGDQVLAAHNSGLDNLFHDAKIEKAFRVRHCRGPCRCMFTIKWLHRAFEDGITVPSSSIMKLTMKSISDHPTVAVLWESIKHMKSSGPSLFLIEDINCDLDLSKMLEEQIKDIGNSAGTIKKEIPKEKRVRIEAKISIPCVTLPYEQSPIRTARSSSNLQANAKLEDSLVKPSTQEVSESRSPLSPLAACAALASKVQYNPKGVAIDGSSMLNSFCSNNMFMKDKLSDDIPATSFRDVSESVQMEKPLILTQRDASWNSHFMELSSGTQNQIREVEDRTSEFINSSAENRTLEFISSITRATCTRRKLKLNHPAKETGLTGSAIQNDDRTSNDNAEVKNCADDLKLRASTNGKRLTRSAFKREQEYLVLEVEAKSSPITVSHSIRQNLAVSESNGTGISKDNVQRMTSADDLKLRASTNGKRFTRSALHGKKESITLELENKSSSITASDSSDGTFAVTECKGTGISTDNGLMKMSADDNSLRASTNREQFTRSALRQDNELVALEVDYKPTHEMESNFSEGQGIVSKKSSCTMKRKKIVSLPLDAEIDNLTIEGSLDRRSNVIQTNQQIQGRSSGNDTDVQGHKMESISLKKQSQRLSPCNFLPRTRSQNKSA